MKGTSCAFIRTCPEVLHYLALGISDPCVVGHVCGISAGEREKKSNMTVFRNRGEGFAVQMLGEHHQRG